MGGWKPVPSTASRNRSASASSCNYLWRCQSRFIDSLNGNDLCRGQSIERGARISLDVGSTAQQQDIDIVGCLTQQARRDKPVTAVVSFAT